MLKWRRCVPALRTTSGLVRVSLLAVVLSVAGCASDEEYRRQAYAQQSAAYQAGAHPSGNMRGPQRPAEPELEDDGLPAQVAPPIRRATTPDDPREPYSPNYGGPAPARRADATAPVVAYQAARRAATH